MKRFLRNTVLFSFLLLLLAGAMESMLRRVPNSFAFKRDLMVEKGLHIRTLVLGSSVAECGIDPSVFPSGTYNLAIAGQWLRFNRKMFDRYECYMPHVKDIVLGICYHTLWNDDNIENDEWSVVEHQIYLGITPDDHNIPRSELISLGSRSLRKWSKYYLTHGQTMFCDSLGLEHDFDFSKRRTDWMEKASGAAVGHTELIRRDTDGLNYTANMDRIGQFVELCRQKGIRLWLVAPPVSEEYYRMTDEHYMAQLRDGMTQVAADNSHVEWLDYLNDRRFSDEDFYDVNHLNSDIGAPKFSRFLYEDMKALGYLDRDSLGV